jgi:hypothetical protein
MLIDLYTSPPQPELLSYQLVPQLIYANQTDARNPFVSGTSMPFVLPPLSRKPLPGQKQFRPEHDYLALLTCPGNREAFHRSAISSTAAGKGFSGASR